MRVARHHPMPDVHTPVQRSFNMSRIRSANAKPELVVRSLVHRLGFRFRLHRRDLPGTPDLALPRLRKLIFVHGCYWHMDRCPFGRVVPRTNAEFWQAKRAGNVRRDRGNLLKARALGWSVLVVWECQTRNPERLAARIRAFLAPPRSPSPLAPASGERGRG